MDDRVRKSEYSDIMQKSYIDYAMSVIISRALPDVRDGLKPVQRRTLYDMHELGIRYDRPYRKSARIVGDTMGKYHPHGDSSIYEALVALTQDFKKSLPLIDGHGNFGNIEGDGAAAMRYTEARLTKVGQEAFLADLDKDVVDFGPNFDETEREPLVLPALLPQLLINGSEGIAVGMATNIPPHNAGEVAMAAIAFLQNPQITTEELMAYMPGPDFPTGGIVANKEDLVQIYEKGSGRLRLRGKVDIQAARGGKTLVVISEIPYTMIGAGIGRFLQEVAALSDGKKTLDILDISNQSSKEGIRIVIELRRDANPEAFVQLLYNKTRLEDSMSVHMLAISQGSPKTLGLRQIFQEFTNFQLEISSRKFRHLLAKEEEKKEVQEGLIAACDCIDLILEILRGCKDRPMALSCLTQGRTKGIRFRQPESETAAARLRFTQRQAQAILDMRLYKLIGLEIQALLAEHEETLDKIARYQYVLSDENALKNVIIEQLGRLGKEYGRLRRTRLEDLAPAQAPEAQTQTQPVVCLVDAGGYARALEPGAYERNQEAAEAESAYVFRTDTDSRLYLLTRDGLIHSIKTADLPLGRFRDKGIPLDNISHFDSSREELRLLCSQSQLEKASLLFISRSGLVKRVAGSELISAKKTMAATKLAEGDALVGIVLLEQQSYLVLGSAKGFFLKMDLEDIPFKKKAALGVRGMQLAPGDHLEQFCCFHEGENPTLTYGNRLVELGKLRLGSRDGKGSKMRSLPQA